MLERAEDLTTAWAYTGVEEIANKDLVLLDNVQFIYELALAESELQALGVEYEVVNGLREFKLLGQVDEKRLRRRLAYFKSVLGELTDYYRIIQHNQTRSVNQYLTHWIYPYKGKFHPQMIRALINVIGVEAGEILLDPFAGSGTTGVESQLLGVNFRGIDTSPLCVLQGQVKSQSISVLPSIKREADSFRAILRESFGDLDGIGNSIDRRISDFEDERVRNFFKLTKLVAVSDRSRRGREFVQSFERNLDAMIASVSDYATVVEELGLSLGDVKVTRGDARRLPFGDGSVNGIITSPPYSIALDYVENDAHALEDMGYSAEKLRDDFIGVRGKPSARVQLYNDDMKQSLDEMYRVLQDGRYAVIVIGNATYLGERIDTVKFVIDYAGSIGLRLVKNMNKIIFGLYNMMKEERILIFQK